MLSYEGKRTNEGCIVTKNDDNRADPLPLRLDLWDHSPTGFEWGYGGSGPAQLSLALLADALGDEEKAVELHQSFKWAVVSRLSQSHWQLLAEDILAAAQQLEQDHTESDTR